jgi:hypothetical protein
VTIVPGTNITETISGYNTVTLSAAGGGSTPNAVIYGTPNYSGTATIGAGGLITGSGGMTLTGSAGGSMNLTSSGSGYHTLTESGTSTLTISPSGGYGQTLFNGQYSAGKTYAVTLTSHSGTVDWNNGNCQRVVLDNAPCFITFVNAVDGGRYDLVVVQPSSGAGTVTWAGTGNNTPTWPSATAPTLSTTNNAVDVISFLCDGPDSYFLGGLSPNYHH